LTGQTSIGPFKGNHRDSFALKLPRATWHEMATPSGGVMCFTNPFSLPMKPIIFTEKNIELYPIWALGDAFEIWNPNLIKAKFRHQSPNRGITLFSTYATTGGIC
jgi:hypothetical protein